MYNTAITELVVLFLQLTVHKRGVLPTLKVYRLCVRGKNANLEGAQRENSGLT